MATPLQIRGWLLIQPKPSSIRVTTVDGEIKKITIASTWAAIAQSIDAMGPELLEALDENDNLIRAVRIASLDDEPAESKAESAVSKAIAIDGETERFRLFATLISDAYKYGYEVAFTKMVELFGAVNARTESIEKSLSSTERMLRKSYEDNLKLQMERAASEGGEGGLASFLTSFLGGMNTGKSESGESGKAEE
jgi:hypothetical protein